jgi:hypothetical protein
MSYDALTDAAGLPRPVELPLLAPARDDPHLPRRHPAHVVNHLAISFCVTAFGRASWRGSFLVGSIPPTSTALLWCVRVQNRRPFRSVLSVRRLLNGVFAPAASTLLRDAVGSPSTVVCAEHERCRKRPPPLVLGFLRCRQDSDERRRGYVSVAPQPILPPMSQTATSQEPNGHRRSACLSASRPAQAGRRPRRVLGRPCCSDTRNPTTQSSATRKRLTLGSLCARHGERGGRRHLSPPMGLLPERVAQGQAVVRRGQPDRCGTHQRDRNQRHVSSATH